MSASPVQVVVPVYKAYTATKNCLKTLYRHNRDDHVILIDDGSHDQRLSALLAHYVAKASLWTLLINPENMGFVQTANRGLKLSPDNTVLLNTDTLVSQGWLQRLQDCAQLIPDLATATPWSNNAEICSLPKTLSNNPLPNDIDTLARALYQHHQPLYPELPTAVGFCMLVTARAKQQLGYFNEAVFGHGYGEENDYSLRASAAGLRNVLVDNAYVAHIGNQSFTEKGLQPDHQS
ncbi:MAG: glycosyltransferase family 2 protein, partial [Proteobacteria bacterium]